MYILETYDNKTRPTLTVDALAEHANENKWFALQIIPQHRQDCVEFKAYYFYKGRPHLLHETSFFIKESGRWVYTTGNLHNDYGKVTIGRNDTCPCHSGKKFKQCCLKKAA
ncbi:YchJ family metal-binding protein [Alteromonas sp. H39]|uniref:YchJ family metal-binding protein n=1 Tax=Alteromonas sp. H39 TaxID=3389876 RepID=UPI0039E0F039